MIIRWILWVDNAISVLFSPPFCEVDHLAIWQNTQISGNLHCESLYPTDVYKTCPRSYVCGCFWHAADTAPFDGLLILRCASYDPLKGLQISKNVAFRNGGIGFDFLASLTCCTCRRMIIGGVGGY